MKKVAVMLAGGKGTRLYPISTEEKPKQFLPLLSDKPMIDESIDRIKPIFGSDSIFINTIGKYKGFIKNKPYKSLIEPKGVGTTASVLFIVLELMKRYGDCVITLLPCDHYIGHDDMYRMVINNVIDNATNTNNINLIGIDPEYPETEYGYIAHEHREVTGFIEKPNKRKAKKLVKHGCLWNSGIFVFKASVMYHLYRNLQKDIYQGFKHAHSRGFLESYYENMKIEPNAFEKAILEHANNIRVVPTATEWSDIGDIDRYINIIKGRREQESWLERLS